MIFRGDRPFKFTTELYYKSLTHLIPYKIVNLDLQYFPEQQSKGYASGLEMRLYGEPVPGAISWISMTVINISPGRRISGSICPSFFRITYREILVRS
ncbi:MAG TPA: hypothetical protein VIK10_10680 [Prolixibacteraceae bacterium]